jgi:hypothetical protein
MDMTEKGRNHGFWRAVAQCVAGIIAFLTVSAVISHLASKLRSRAEQLASTNAAAFSSNCRQGQ